ncbi:class I adenylate-forming enzyme family protein [Bosea sp. NPDC055332]
MDIVENGIRPAAWSAAEQEPLPATIQQLLDDTAARFPSRPLWRSMEGENELLSYEEIRRSSIRCANAFRSLGVRKGTHVALMLPNVPAFLVSWIALCRLGAVGVLVNTASTDTELERIVLETDVAFLVIDRAFLDRFTNLSPGVAFDDRHVIVHGAGPWQAPSPEAHDWAALVEAAAIGESDHPVVGLDDIAGILFTSGSSGVPKGCMLSHRYWLTIGKARSVLGPSPASVMVDTPMFYMGCLWKILMAVYCGATINVAPRLSLSRLIDRIVENDIEFCTLTAPAATLPPDPRLKASSLKWLTTYGLAKELHAGMEERFGVPVREIYGMTEVGSVLSMPVEDTTMVGSGSCGLPAAFRTCKLMMDGHEVEGDGPGELWVAGQGLFSGYYKKDDATKAAFEGNWFKTGDLFRRDSNGYYFMLGRIKDVIRRSSENISAAEVEMVVMAIEGVLDAAAVPVPDAFRGEEVKIVVTRAPTPAGETLTATKIVAACKEVLSAYKVPRFVQFLDQMPKTASAKIDKVKLKAEASIMTSSIFDATQNSREGQ